MKARIMSGEAPALCLLLPLAGACIAPGASGGRSTPPPTPQAIVQAGAPVLRAVAVEVEPGRVHSTEVQQLIRSMIAVMRAAPGVGLAAPQIGVPLRVFVLEDREELAARMTAEERRERERTPFPVRVFLNPTLRPLGSEQKLFFEGCLSVKGFTALVPRSAEVELSGLDEHGAPQRLRLRGWPARIAQHEMDHLNGTLYLDRMLPRSYSTLEQARALYGGKPSAEILRLLGVRDASPTMTPAESAAEVGVRALLEEQAAAWNRGDLEGYMGGYWRSPALTFYAGGTVTSGWGPTLERYRRRYQGVGRAMGHLVFDEVQVEILGDSAALARGRWRLRFAEDKHSRGLFTVLLRRSPQGWRVVHDHSSSE